MSSEERLTLVPYTPKQVDRDTISQDSSADFSRVKDIRGPLFSAGEQIPKKDEEREELRDDCPGPPLKVTLRRSRGEKAETRTTQTMPCLPKSPLIEGTVRSV